MASLDLSLPSASLSAASLRALCVGFMHLVLYMRGVVPARVQVMRTRLLETHDVATRPGLATKRAQRVLAQVQRLEECVTEADRVHGLRALTILLGPSVKSCQESYTIRFSGARSDSSCESQATALLRHISRELIGFWAQSDVVAATGKAFLVLTPQHLCKLDASSILASHFTLREASLLTREHAAGRGRKLRIIATVRVTQETKESSAIEAAMDEGGEGVDGEGRKDDDMDESDGCWCFFAKQGIKRI